jgi:hypothetical protein
MEKLRPLDWYKYTDPGVDVVSREYFWSLFGFSLRETSLYPEPLLLPAHSIQIH